MIRYKIQGQVQGVGFRPFIYKLATQLLLNGSVRNTTLGVEIEIQATVDIINEFEQKLYTQLPPLARIDKIDKQEIKGKAREGFIIAPSKKSNQSTKALISPDIATCNECLEDIKKEKKYANYFATNCTNCGPRYSIINALAYDRNNSAMKDFKMCLSCQDEYKDPTNRRYHTQSISCIYCGPQLDGCLNTIIKSIKEGNIVAIKGIGGFQLLCDAKNSASIAQLRVYKNRPKKPLAVMFKDIKDIKKIANVSLKEEAILTSYQAPIVLLEKSIKIPFLEDVSPQNNKVGCFLPYSIIHHLILNELKTPVVVTSANLSGEPIITKAKDIYVSFPWIKKVLNFNRKIENSIDDSVVQVINEKLQILRLARGFAPKVIKLSHKLKKVILAVGAHEKSSIAIAFDEMVILSPYIGDLESISSFEKFKQTIELFKRLYNINLDVVVCDKHPQYQSTKWAKEYAKDKILIKTQHHLAHIYSCKAEYGLSGDYLGFSFDGSGYGDDGSIKGGEVFIGDKLKYSFKSIKLLGASKAIKEPRRVALSMLFDKFSLEEIFRFKFKFLNSFKKKEIEILYNSYHNDINAPRSSSVGRLFDAMASFGAFLEFQTFQGEAGLICEMHYDSKVKESFPYSLDKGIIDINFDFFDNNLISKFFNTLVEIIANIAKLEKLDIILSGGVFQNKRLLQLITKRLINQKTKYYFQKSVPINDSGIALGQIFMAIKELNKEK